MIVSVQKSRINLISHLLSARHTLASGLLRSHWLMCALESARQSIVGNYQFRRDGFPTAYGLKPRICDQTGLRAAAC